MRKKLMLYFFIFLSSLVFLAGCGKKEEDNGYYIIETDTVQVFTPVKSAAEVLVLGTRFYQGEPVQLLGYRNRDSETGEKYIDIYLRNKSGEEEKLWDRIPEEYGFGSWYLDGDGNGYCFYLNEAIRYDKGGGERYRRTYESAARFTDACVRDKSGILLLGQTQQGMLNLLELDPDTGEFSQTGVTLETESVGTRNKVFISGNGKGFLVLDSNGIWEGDMEKGRKQCILSFSGGTYVPDEVTDFQILQDGKAEILCGNMMETVWCVDISKERKVLVLRVGNINSHYWLPEAIVRFNQENGEYYIAVEERPEEEDGIAFQERTAMELALGKGPDIVLGVLMDPSSLVSKGALEDLSTYMEASGIQEEDYFPAAFDCLRGEGLQGTDSGIYGINAVLELRAGRWFISSLFPNGVKGGLSVDDLLNALEAYEGNAVYSRTGSGLMEILLEASDSLCGMVDWENGTCDFTGGRLKRILELCSRYGSGGDENAPVLCGAMLSQFYLYTNIFGNEEEMAKRNMVAMGCLFDEGCHAGTDYYSRMSVSSASRYKEGAWEFIRFLLSDEEQTKISWVERDSIYPSSRKAFDELIAREIDIGGPVVEILRADGTTIKHSRMGIYAGDVPWYKENTYYALTEEKVENVRKMLEEARAFPLRTIQIRTIIREEADAYFSGDRSADEVCANIQNRVQLYLSEHQ